MAVKNTLKVEMWNIDDVKRPRPLRRLGVDAYRLRTDRTPGVPHGDGYALLRRHRPQMGRVYREESKKGKSESGRDTEEHPGRDRGVCEAGEDDGVR